jgi:GDPmannose 4,6-dehydratase
VIVRIDPRYFRPAEVEYVLEFTLFCQSAHLKLDSLLLGNPEKAEKKLGWKRQVVFDALVKEMVEADVAASKNLVEDQN